MKALIRFEFLKILRRRSTLFVMATSLFIMAVFFGLPILQFQTYSREGVIKGLAGIAYEKEQYQKISVPLTDEYIAHSIREVQELFADENNLGYDGNEVFLVDDAYWNGIAPRENLLNLIAGNYAPPYVSEGYNSLPKLDISEGADFYQARRDKIEMILNDPSKELSDAEKACWRSLTGKVGEPFQYGYFGGWEILLSALELLMFAVLSVCIVIAPVFAGEYQAGTDAVILAGKYGKTRLPVAKILAALLFGIIAFTLHVLVAFAVVFAAFGTEGWNLPLQINGTAVPYPLTFLEGTLICLAVIYIVLTAMISLTLFLSARMKSPYQVLIIIVPVLFIPMFLSPNGTSGLYNKLVFLTPYQSLRPLFGTYLSYQCGPIVLDAFAMRAVLYAVITMILLPSAKRFFQNHQVS